MTKKPMPDSSKAETSPFDRFASLAKRIIAVKKSDLPDEKPVKRSDRMKRTA